VEVAGAETNLPIVRETKFRAQARLKRKSSDRRHRARGPSACIRERRPCH
jgi:hypothetical protein